MKKTSIFKLTIRSIGSFFGRYMALLWIVALSVGFFSGLKITKDAMAHTAEEFLKEQNFYDFRLISTFGFSEKEVERIVKEDFVSQAEGGKTIDALMEHKSTTKAYKLLSMPKNVNKVSVTAGRMPKNNRECLVDKHIFTKDDIGTTITVSDKNDSKIKERISGEEYTIVGLVDSPVYMGLDRGNTSIGSGVLNAFLYLPEDNFTGNVYTEISLVLTQSAPIYSSTYDDLIEKYTDRVEELTVKLANEQYKNQLAQQNISKEEAAAFGVVEPETYVLTRKENAGYVSFKNDTAIVSGIANIFPVFFILIAILVCITTMTRMVDEERTQIGTLKALGFGNGTITAKYLLYAGSATVIGWSIGFFLGTWGLPKLFWYAYRSLYSFAPLSYLFSAKLAIITLIMSLMGILGSAWISCQKELGEVAAMLIRPKGTKNGKRIFLERFTFLWKRLPFLSKVTIRNMFRYKRRLIMMLVGISCCAGLVVAAFGVRDSMIHIGDRQYEDIQLYKIEVTFLPEAKNAVLEQIKTLDGISDTLGCQTDRVELQGKQILGSVDLYSFENADKIDQYWNFTSDGKSLAFPQNGEVLISTQAAKKMSLSVGDTLKVKDNERHEMTVTVSGIFDNYINHVIVVSSDTYAKSFGKEGINTLLIHTKKDVQGVSEQLTRQEEILSVSNLSTVKKKVEDAMFCVDYIICMVVAFSGALAFIVIFNLTNINLAERSREIATVEVLGFYPQETESYVLHENLILTAIAALIGLPLGTAFHRVAMGMIYVDGITFQMKITAVSYILSVLCTLVFALIVNLFMKRQITKIQMAESLKAVE